MEVDTPQEFTFTSFTERYFDSRQVGETVLLIHKNGFFILCLTLSVYERLCVIILADSHPLCLTPEAIDAVGLRISSCPTIYDIDFIIGGRDFTKVADSLSGKRKKGGIVIYPSSTICKVL